MNKITFLFLAFLLMSCERAPSVQPPQKVDSVKIFFFAAGYCHPCKHEAPIIQKWYDELPALKKMKIKPTFYLIAGNPASKPASPEAAADFKKETGISFEVIPDKYARIYRKYYESGTAVPATVILTEQDQAIKTYTPGIVSPETLGRDLDEILK